MTQIYLYDKRKKKLNTKSSKDFFIIRKTRIIFGIYEVIFINIWVALCDRRLICRVQFLIYFFEIISECFYFAFLSYYFDKFLLHYFKYACEYEDKISPRGGNFRKIATVQIWRASGYFTIAKLLLFDIFNTTVTNIYYVNPQLII